MEHLQTKRPYSSWAQQHLQFPYLGSIPTSHHIPHVLDQFPRPTEDQFQIPETGREWTHVGEKAIRCNKGYPPKHPFVARRLSEQIHYIPHISTSHRVSSGSCSLVQVAELMLRVSEYNQMLGEDASKNHGFGSSFGEFLGECDRELQPLLRVRAAVGVHIQGRFYDLTHSCLVLQLPFRLLQASISTVFLAYPYLPELVSSTAFLRRKKPSSFCNRWAALLKPWDTWQKKPPG